MPDSGQSQSKRLVEIRCYTLTPGAAAEFERLVTERALPLLHRAGVDVVAYGPSLHDDHAYHLIRAYVSLAELRRSEEAVYGSKAWRRGPRRAILDCIEQYTSVVIELDDTTVDGLRLGR